MDQRRRRFFFSLVVLPAAAIAITTPTAAAEAGIEGRPPCSMEYAKALLAATRDKLKAQYRLVEPKQ